VKVQIFGLFAGHQFLALIQNHLIFLAKAKHVPFRSVLTNAGVVKRSRARHRMPNGQTDVGHSLQRVGVRFILKQPGTRQPERAICWHPLVRVRTSSVPRSALNARAAWAPYPFFRWPSGDRDIRCRIPPAEISLIASITRAAAGVTGTELGVSIASTP
jgi:hypothetical protein